ncbi:MAG: AGE family epimerase/isomerase [Ancalomicrobiaceae bacterium]|nr:AGE family epimerase/isomerase [Ancalomicrobiaceae bacterium]
MTYPKPLTRGLAGLLLLGSLLLGSLVVSAGWSDAVAVSVRYDRIQGTLESADAAAHDLVLALRDGSRAKVHVSDTAWVHLVRAMDGLNRRPGSGAIYDLPKGALISASGLVYSDRDELVAKEVTSFGAEPKQPVIEDADWWSSQARELSRFWVRAQGGDDGFSLDPSRYQTRITKSGSPRPKSENLQETDTVSRLVYGFSSTYLMTGEIWILDAAKKLVDLQRSTMRYQSADGRYVYWAHAVKDGKRILPSLFADDEGTIPLYEQIYALAGLTQYYRITGDPEVLADIERTVAFMDAHYWDGEPRPPLMRGYFSHADPATFDPAAPVERNRLKKNWNSVGDHIPAYLGNLYLATANPAYLARIRELGDLIVAHFPDPASPFVFERFTRDWQPDLTYTWQQNRAVIGHNLKIAWILTRLYHLTGDEKYLKTARRCADLMIPNGEDLRRGGWYDVVERIPDARTGRYELTWHDRKAWWQQEQGILAYYVLYGTTREASYLEAARAGSAFYNISFPDLDDGDVYFDVQADGTPYLLGDRADKGSHSKSGYHDMELAYFAHLYTNLLVQQRQVGLHFRPQRASPGQILAVQPISFPKGSVRLDSVTVDGKPHADFDAAAMTIRLPQSDRPLDVVAVIAPVPSAQKK